MLKISMKTLTNFMAKSTISRKTLVKNLKYPKSENKIPIVYYQKALSSIKKFHKDNLDVTFLQNQIKKIIKEADIAEKQGTKKWLMLNAVAIEHYIEFFSNKKYEILAMHRIASVFNNVVVSSTPDLYVKEREQHKLIKLDFSKDEPDEDIPAIITHLMFEAQNLLGLGISPKNIVYMDVFRGNEYPLRISKDLLNNITSACDDFESIWNSI